MNHLPLIGHDAYTATGRARLKYFWRDVVAPALRAVWRGELALGGLVSRIIGR